MWDSRPTIADQGFPPFVERPPWLGPDLQTLRNLVRRRLRWGRPKVLRYPDQRLWLAMPDGDRLTAVLNRPVRPTTRPLVMIIHGLTGCETSDYMLATADTLLARGYPTFRLNLRGAGPSRGHCRDQYHAGRSDDLRHVLYQLDPAETTHGIILVAYSLGANMMLKFLGEEGERAVETGVRCAVSVSAPIDLAAASRRMMERRNRLYHRMVLGWMKREATAPVAAVSADERRRIAGAKSVYAFDDRFVAPRHGFGTADVYYRSCQAKSHIRSIRVPTLIIQALDDPWIPAEAYLDFDWSVNPYLTPLLPGRGGHVGFHGRGETVPWHDRCLAQFCKVFS